MDSELNELEASLAKAFHRPLMENNKLRLRLAILESRVQPGVLDQPLPETIRDLTRRVEALEDVSTEDPPLSPFMKWLREKF